jgi:hypothetical protein
MQDTLKWIFGSPTEKTVGSPASLASAMAGIFLFVTAGRLVTREIINSVLPHPVYPISCSTFLIHAAVMVAVNLTVLASFVIATTLLGRILAGRVCSSQKRVALWYTARILAFTISIIAIPWAVWDSVEGPSFSFAAATVAVAACVFALSLVDPLKARLETVVGLRRSDDDGRSGSNI